MRALIKAIREAVDPLKLPYEVVITDDCSQDKSWEILKELAAGDPRIRVQRFAFNCGESAASWAGMKAARGKYLVTLDADLQNDPKDLPKFLEALKQFDCVCGTRVKARGEGDHFIRVASSRIANWVRNKLSGEHIADAGCTYRAFKRECIDNLKFFKGMHRFLPTLFKIEGHTVTEIEVTQQSALCRPEPLRRVEPAVRVVLRFARRALDEEADVQIPNRGENQLKCGTGFQPVCVCISKRSQRQAGCLSYAIMQRFLIITANCALLALLLIGLPAATHAQWGDWQIASVSTGRQSVVLGIGHRDGRKHPRRAHRRQRPQRENSLLGMGGGFCRVTAGLLGIQAWLFQFQLVETDVALAAKSFLTAAGRQFLLMTSDKVSCHYKTELMAFLMLIEYWM